MQEKIQRELDYVFYESKKIVGKRLIELGFDVEDTFSRYLYEDE